MTPSQLRALQLTTAVQMDLLWQIDHDPATYSDFTFAQLGAFLAMAALVNVSVHASSEEQAETARQALAAGMQHALDDRTRPEQRLAYTCLSNDSSPLKH